MPQHKIIIKFLLSHLLNQTPTMTHFFCATSLVWDSELTASFCHPAKQQCGTIKGKRTTPHKIIICLGLNLHVLKLFITAS